MVTAALKIPGGLTIRISVNAREKTTRILAYRKGGFKRAYKAVLPMCSLDLCRHVGPHIESKPYWDRDSSVPYYVKYTFHHQNDVNNLVKKIIKSYS